MKPTCDSKPAPVADATSVPVSRDGEPGSERRGRGGRGGSAFSIALLCLVCSHAAVFVFVSVYTQRRMDDLDHKFSLQRQDLGQSQEEAEPWSRQTAHVFIDEHGPAPRHQPGGPGRVRRDSSGGGPADSVRDVARQACRQEVAEVLKQLSDVTAKADDATARASLRMRIDAWAMEADDRKKRAPTAGPATTGNELGGIFGQIADAELAIFEQYCGNASKICMPGAKGVAGAKGAAGAAGQKGDLGIPGTNGADGAPGIKGEAGARGEKGAAGYSGPPGPKGASGVPGIPGLQGTPGVKGDRGAAGTAGSQGTPGVKGEPGVKGQDGYSGPPGPKGANGLAGLPGTRGPQGAAGLPGATGQRGPKGTAGLPGVKGEAGARGPSGSSGPPGPKGGSGMAGLPGLQGMPGEKGAAGATGQPGPQGAVGLKGDSGLPGTNGVAGLKGEMGQAGYNGPPGPKGESGYPGVPGGKGPKGEPGVWSPGQNSCCMALSKPKFSETTEMVTVRQDQSLSLTCGAQSFPPAVVTWEPAGALQADPRVQIHEGSLVVTGAQLTDTRHITCTATNALGTSKKTFDIHVMQHLVVAERPSNVTVTEGAAFHLVCRFTNLPPPTITWYHEAHDGTRTPLTSGVVSSANGTSTFTKTNTQVADKGTYVCEGTNGLETTSLREHVDVLSKPYITSTSGPAVLAGTGEDLVLHCDSDSVPPATIRWSHNRNDSHVFEDTQGNLHLVDLRPVDAGVYTCIATNPLGQDSKDLSVTVQVPPSATMQPPYSPLKPTLFFDCLVSGDAPLTVEWLKDGAPLDVKDAAKFIVIPDTGTGSHRLLVLSTSETDVGRYDCMVANKHAVTNGTSYVYHDLNAVKCSDTFASCVASTCGAHCPANCKDAPDPVYGTLTYTQGSSICRAAIQAGTLSGAGAVVWVNSGYPGLGTFVGTSQNGVTSLGHASEQIAATPMGLDVSNP